MSYLISFAIFMGLILGTAALVTIAKHMLNDRRKVKKEFDELWGGGAK